MPTFVVLGNWTQKRMESIKEMPAGLKGATETFSKYRVKPKALVFTMGRYDLVGIFDAPNAEAMSKAFLRWSSQGLLRTETLLGFAPEKMVQIVDGIQ